MKRIARDGGASVMLHTCEICGADASFGIGVEVRQSLIKLSAGDAVTAKRMLGKWYCAKHKADGGEAVK